MNILLIFFAIPVAVILLSIVLQRILKCPILVAITAFAIFLIVTFVIGDLTFLIATIVYTIIAYITATLTKIICKLVRRLGRNSACGSCICDNNCCDNDENSLLPVTVSISEESIEDIARATTREILNAINCNNSNNSNCGCNNRSCRKIY